MPISRGCSCRSDRRRRRPRRWDSAPWPVWSTSSVLRGTTGLWLLAAMQWTQDGPASLAVMVPALVLTIAYFGVCETVWGASPGKWIFGLRVVTTGLRPVDGRRAFIRAGLWTLSTLPGGLAWLVLGPQTLSATASGAGTLRHSRRVWRGAHGLRSAVRDGPDPERVRRAARAAHRHACRLHAGVRVAPRSSAPAAGTDRVRHGSTAGSLRHPRRSGAARCGRRLRRNARPAGLDSSWDAWRAARSAGAATGQPAVAAPLARWRAGRRRGVGRLRDGRGRGAPRCLPAAAILAGGPRLVVRSRG